MSDKFLQILSNHTRVGIAGGSKTGKSTLSALCKDRNVLHIDDLIIDPNGKYVDWGTIPDLILTAVGTLGPSFLIEGSQLPRALRKGLQLDAVIWLDETHVPLTAKQEQFNKGILTTWKSLDLTKYKVYYL